MSGWAVEFSEDHKQVRAVVGAVETKWRPATDAERALLDGDRDDALAFQIARSFFPAPDDIAGEYADAKWFHLK